MKRKFIFFTLILVFIMPFLLSACGEQAPQTKGNQTFNLIILNVYQDSYGAVHIEFENAQQYMDVQKTDEVISYNPTIEISCDNGTIWADYYFTEYEDLNSGVILYFDETDNDYTNGDLLTSYSIGYELNIIARIKGNTSYYPSNSTAIYSYTLKTAVSDKHISSCNIETEQDFTGTIDRSTYGSVDGENIYYDGRFEYLNINGEICVVDYVLYLYNSVVKIGTVVINENTYTVTPSSDYANFEYRFANDETTLADDTYSYDNYDYNSEGWTAVSSTGITFSLGNLYERFGVFYLNVLVREKETTQNCFSICDFLTFEIAIN